MDKITSYAKIITPEIAEVYLSRNYENNRTAKRTSIDRMAEDMANGKWVLTHQGIAFDPDGYMFDGANRMRAVIKAGVPVEMMVYVYKDWDIANAALHALDIGTRRCIKDIMNISKEDFNTSCKNSSVIGAVRRLIQLENGRSISSVTSISDETVMQYLRDHAEELDAVYHLCHGVSGRDNGKNILSIVFIAMLKAYRNGVDHQNIYDFTDAYVNNTVAYPGRNYNVKMAFDCRDFCRTISRKRSMMTDDLYRIENYFHAFSNNRRTAGKNERYPIRTIMSQEVI